MHRVQAVARLVFSGLAVAAVTGLKRAKRLKAHAVVTLVQSSGRTTVRRSTVVLKAPRGR